MPQFVVKHIGAGDLITVETEQTETGVLVRIDGVVILQCLDGSQTIEVYPDRLASRALKVNVIEAN